MNATFSLFPKFFKHLSVEALAELVGEVGLDTTNLVVREGYWADRYDLAETLPAFVEAMRSAGVEVTFATTGLSPDQLLFDPTPLKIFADSGITQFRMDYFRQVEGQDIRMSFVTARHKLQLMVDLCAEAKVRAIYQVHHGTLIPSASAAFGLINGMDSEWVGVELDPGNQAFEGHERPALSVGLLGEYLAAVGVKDTTVSRDPARAAEPDKGWKRTWTTLDEGETNWHELAAALHEADFAGHLVFMPFYDADAPDAMTAKLRRDVAYLRKAIADVEAAAKARAAEEAEQADGAEQDAPS